MLPWAASACPTGTQPRTPTTQISVESVGSGEVALDAAGLASLPQGSLAQRQSVTSSASGVSERSVTYAAVLLRDVLARSGFGAPTDCGARVGVIEALATDGYRAVCSWGELFKSSLGERVLVISTQDGNPWTPRPNRWRCAHSATCSRGPDTCASAAPLLFAVDCLVHRVDAISVPA